MVAFLISRGYGEAEMLRGGRDGEGWSFERIEYHWRMQQRIKHLETVDLIAAMNAASAGGSHCSQVRDEFEDLALGVFEQ